VFGEQFYHANVGEARRRTICRSAPALPLSGPVVGSKPRNKIDKMKFASGGRAKSKGATSTSL
jgi:hypothetical protein